MLLGRRRSDPAQAIQDFWHWWSTAHGRLVSVAGTDGRDGAVAEITARVRAIDAGLQWEWGRGASSRYALVVSSGGEPRLRATAERWLAAAPAADASWEFHSSRQANPGLAAGTMRVGELDLALSDLRLGLRLDAQRYQLAVTAYHPVFPVLTQRQREQVTFLALDWTIGEGRAGIWLASVDAVASAPVPARTATDLVAAVAKLEALHTGNTWMVSTHGRRVSLVQVPLRPARWPRFDTHVGVRVAYADRDAERLPGPASVPRLRALQDRLTGVAGSDGELVAHETGDGRRLLHFYVDGATDAAARLSDVVAGWPEGHHRTRRGLDPAMQRVAHLWAA
jgi:hypothetical protein